ncbi:guanine nucleotide-binding protein subunit alpha-11-like [Rhinatrema bivittatum]|uniref:guanine nucleotide-binding protein subunit alpha-11-like n=1 Tax=Rhinatrema bivittatum TaxID=194408 RepID=UPI001128A6DE|nr:guanine nucleotide-binding protein subunit alpha-11-like [Rhinatrema bivittatum]
MAWWCCCCCRKSGCCLTEDEKVAVALDREISRMLKDQKKRNRQEMKLLLLGTGESGKSTFIKQMRIIHGTGYSSEERKGFARLVYQNIFMSMQAMIGAMETLRVQYTWEENRYKGKLVNEVDVYQVVMLEKLQANAIQSLWNDPGIQLCYERRREYHLLDSANYYLSNLERIAQEGYLPTDEDILRIRMPTTGINEYCFSVEKMQLRIVDVGGQKSERRKWIHCFENVISMIYLASLSEYDQSLEENNKENRMRESLALFAKILEFPWFQETPIILFLNKMDILAEKIKDSDLVAYFPEFRGPKQDTEAAKMFIMEKYKEIYLKSEMNTSKNLSSKRRMFYPHYTCATDTQNIRKVFNNVKESVLIQSLEAFSLM